MRLHTYAVDCDTCGGRGCSKCDAGRIHIREADPKAGHVPLIVAVIFVIFALLFLLAQLHKAETTPLPASSQVATLFSITVGDLDHRGRIPMTGAPWAMVNNAWQSATGHAADLGCGGQSEVLYTRLEGHVPGWQFEMRYAVGPQSPILLPHQWVTGHGPHGEVVQLDPWMGEIR